MLLKAMSPRHFSIITFGVAQVLIDLEVLWNMTRPCHQLHTRLHTYLGASLVVLVAFPLGQTLGTWTRRIWNLTARRVSSFDMTVPGQTTWTAAVLGAAIGAYSHVLFDSFYHRDIEPLRPWSTLNPCQGIVDPFKMEIVFNALFILGLVRFTIGELLRMRAQQGRKPCGIHVGNE